MSAIQKQVTGIFTLSIGDKKYHNLVVNTGLGSIYKNSAIGSLCETIKVFNDDTEVTAADTDYVSPVASSANITATQYGVSGSGTSDYFYMRRTWTFSQGQILGVINKLAVYSDDGTLYAAALLKNEAGEIEPVRPLFAPKVEVTYESRWHFKQGDSFTTGTQVLLGDAGIVTVKQNKADKNNPISYQSMNLPFAITAVELFSDAITTDDSKPTQSLGVIDAEDYTVEYVNGQYGVYGQILKLHLPENKYINDTPIATIVVTTTRGLWQFGFDAPLEKPTLSKRTLKINLPFVHGTIEADGSSKPVGSPDAFNSIFSDINNCTYNVSLAELTYTTGKITGTTDGMSAKFKSPGERYSIQVPTTGTVVVAMGANESLNSYLSAMTTGITVTIKAGTAVISQADSKSWVGEAVTFEAGDVLDIVAQGGSIQIKHAFNEKVFNSDVSTAFADKPAHSFLAVKDIVTGNKVVVA